MKKIKFVNLTPYDITVGNREPIPATGNVARLNAQTFQARLLDGIPVFETAINGVTGVPAPQENTYYIVPAIVRQHYPHRKDLLSPAKLVRDKTGAVQRCLGLEMNRSAIDEAL